MGPQRQAWTFPKGPEALIEALVIKRSKIIFEINENLDKEQLLERDLAEFRERLRVAGVEGWATATQVRGTGYARDPFSDVRAYYNRLAATLKTVESYLEAIRHDQVRDPDRLYRLTYDDLEWFGF